jgi:hypothetical protein
MLWSWHGLVSVSFSEHLLLYIASQKFGLDPEELMFLLFGKGLFLASSLLPFHGMLELLF